MDTIIHIKTDIKTRDEAKKIAAEFGLGSLTSLVNVLLKQVVRTKQVNLSLDETPNAATIEALRQSEEDVKAGRVKRFETGEEVLAYVRSLNKYEKSQL